MPWYPEGGSADPAENASMQAAPVPNPMPDPAQPPVTSDGIPDAMPPAPPQPVEQPPLARIPMSQNAPDPFAAGPSGLSTISAAVKDTPIVSVLRAVNAYSADSGAPDGHTLQDIMDAVGGPNSRIAQGPNGIEGALGYRTIQGVKAWADLTNAQFAEQDTLAASGWAGTVASLAAGFFDPTLLMFPELKGLSVAAASRRAATFGALSSSVSGAALQASNSTVTTGDTLKGIASGTILMGLLGAVHGVLAPGERVEGAKILDEVRAGDPQIAPNPADVSIGSAGIDGLNDNNPGGAALAQGVGQGAGQGVGLDQSIGAASTDLRTLEPKPIPLLSAGLDAIKDVPLLGTASETVRNLANNLSPNLRLFNNGAVSARRAMADLAETAIKFQDHDQGITTSRGGPALETLYRVQRNRLQMAAHDILLDNWSDHYYGEDTKPGLLDQAKTAYNSATGNVPEGKLDYKSFKENVADAMTNGDTHDVPQVLQAARDLRAQIYDPIKDLAQKTADREGNPLFREDASAPAGDKSFVNRVWNKVAVTSRRFDLKQTISDWLNREQDGHNSIKDALSGLQSQHEEFGNNLSKLESRLQTLDNNTKMTQARLQERTMAEGVGQKRADTLEQRQSDLKDSLANIDETIATLKGATQDPSALEFLNNLEAEAASMRKEIEPLSGREATRLDRADAQNLFQNKDVEQGGKMFLGQVARGKPASFIERVRKSGGLTKEAAQNAGLEASSVKKMTMLGGRDLDQLGEHLMESYPEHFQGVRPTENEVSDMLRESQNGREPAFFEQAESQFDDKAAGRAHADNMAELLRDHEGPAPANMHELAQALMTATGEKTGRVAKMEASFDTANQLSGLEGNIADRRGALKDMQGAIQKARIERDARIEKLRSGEAKIGEAEHQAYQHTVRASILEDRLEAQAKEKEILQGLVKYSEDGQGRTRAAMEDQVRQWKGNTTADAMSALKSRAKAEAGRDPSLPRLKSADAPVDGAIKNMLARDTNLTKAELDSRADEIIDRIQGSSDGRLPYDDASPQTGFQKPGETRGSLNSRDFAIPTALVKDYVVRDMDHLVGAHVRTTLPDIMLTQKFGDTSMQETFRKINEEYASKVDAATTEKQARDLRKQQEADIRDLAAARDRFRQVYGLPTDPGTRQIAAVSRDFKNYMSLTSLGTSALNRFNDWGASAVFRYGFMNVFHDQWAPMLSSMMGMSDHAKVSKALAKEAQVGIDGALGHMRYSLADLTENDMPGNKFSRGLAWANDRSMLVNLHGPETDWAKAMGWVPAQAEFRRTLERIAGGSATKSDLARMADANIPHTMYDRLLQQFQDHSVTSDSGVKIANTASWTDPQARELLEAALSREMNINVITPGIGDRPLFLSKPIGSLLGQFKGFVAGAHEKMLISNIQQADGRTMQGLLASVAMGMMSYRLYTLASGQPVSTRPQDWVKEGVHRAAIGGWFDEANNVSSKLSGGVVDYNRLYGADHPLTRRVDNSAMSELLGPSYSRLEGIVMGGEHMVAGKANNQDVHNLRTSIPLQNLMGVRIALDRIEAGVSNALGIKPRDPNAVH